MKTTLVLVALLVGGIIPAYSQLNRHRKAERRADQFSQKVDEDFFPVRDKSQDKLKDSWHAWTPYDIKMPPAEPTPNESKGHAHPRDYMPVLKPSGIFHMRLFQPEGKFFMKVYLLDW